jgi:ABC-type glycerol-3-phosphate transport system permease component
VERHRRRRRALGRRRRRRVAQGPRGHLADGQLGAVDFGALQAGVTLAMLPPVILFLALQRYYVSGLIAGSVKA